MGRTEGYSLERRLLVRLVAVLLVLAGGLYLAVASYAHRAAERAYDRLLLASAYAIADTVQIDDGRITVDLPYAALATLATGGRDRIFYRVTAPDGSPITGYADLAPDLPLARSNAPRFMDALYRGAPLRAALVGRFVAAPERGGWTTILVAQTREDRTALANEILANAFGPIALAVLVAAGLIWLGVRRALAPLAFLEGLIARRAPADLSPITAEAPIEVAQLLAALNRFMERLQASLRLMQTFLADAAHQIGTPLASLRAQAELALEEDEPALLRARVRRIHRNAAFASQITSQLLSHAMVTHRHEVVRPEAVDLASLARQVVQRATAGAYEVAVELDLTDLAAPAAVTGDPIALREAMANLLDNAVKYAGSAGPVRLRLERASGAPIVRLEVQDRGPGIPEGEKERALQRFCRGSTSGEIIGSGLGLAIVEAVAIGHGAALSLLDRPGGGLVARLDFPAAADAGQGGRTAAAALACLGLLAPLLVAAPAPAAPTVYPAPAEEGGRLRIDAATDPVVMEPLIGDFQALRPDVAVEYSNLDTLDLHRRILAAADGRAPDIAISSAMDLQVKLVNDGFTQPYLSAATARLPPWANWRDEAFGLTFEPAVIVHSLDHLPAAEVPRSRPALIRLLQEHPEPWRRRVATYDIARSGVGYLFATQDSVLSSQFWRLAGTLGDVQTRLFGTSGEMLDAIERGEVLLGYNVLGSYARARTLAGARIGIVLPEDYTLVMSRVAVLPRHAGHPALGKQFLDYLLSERGQDVVARATGERAVLSPGDDGASLAPLAAAATGPVHPIPVGPALLVFLDPLKKERFLANWWLALQPP
jgi:two-component system sensor histidine kinase TctE